MQYIAAAGRRPKELVFTLFGDFLLHRRKPVWVGSLIRLLEPLGLSAGNVRTVLSRMVAAGWLRSRREGRRAYYELSGRGRRLLEEGETRIHEPPRSDEWDGEWTLLAYSIPEQERELRDRLRPRLTWLGFGSLGNGLWISPHDVADRVAAIGRELGVLDRLEVFRSRHRGFSERSRLVERCWDLAAINAGYESFLDRHMKPCLTLREANGASAIEPREAYVRRFELVHEFRAFPLLDPFLPRPLHTPDWAGECALWLFRVYRELLREPAERFVAEAIAAAGAVDPDPASARARPDRGTTRRR